MNPFDHVADNALYGLLAIVSILVVASGIVHYLVKSNPAKDYQELVLRIRSWWIMIALFSTAIVLSKQASIVFLAITSFLALKEYLSLISTRRADRRVLFWVYLAIPIQYYWISIAWYGMFIIFIPVYMFLFLPLRMILIGETAGFLKAVGTLHWGLMITVFSLSHTAYLLALPEVVSPAGGAGLVLFLVFLTQFNDVAQYVFGKMFGKHKVIPKVSPKKTWEGLAGGVATTTLLSFLISPWLTPLSQMESIAVGCMIGLAGFIGDVTISCLKRDLNIKDSGQILPGHGGILDRVDSLTYTAPLFFHVLYYLHY
jgi:phosphatidate cytidylyltransferase